jgi:ribosomal protein S18 acetylase RimI-like enzyme
MEVSVLEKAAQGDREEILSMILKTVDHLNQNGIHQWDEVYPCADNVDEDIRNGQLYFTRAEGQIAGIVTLNRQSDPDYKIGRWQYRGPDFMVVHRLIVSPALQGHGIGTRLMIMTEAMLREQGVQSVRLDAFTQNPHSLRLYEKLGYRVAGEVTWRKGIFYLMEKDIAAER